MNLSIAMKNKEEEGREGSKLLFHLPLHPVGPQEPTKAPPCLLKKEDQESKDQNRVSEKLKEKRKQPPDGSSHEISGIGWGGPSSSGYLFQSLHS